MPIYKFIEYSNSYSDTFGSLYHFKRDKSPVNAENPINVALDNSSSFKYKSGILGKATAVDGNDRSFKNVKIVLPLKHLSNFF